jgi:hypothetical protein
MLTFISKMQAHLGTPSTKGFLQSSDECLPVKYGEFARNFRFYFEKNSRSRGPHAMTFSMPRLYIILKRHINNAIKIPNKKYLRFCEAIVLTRNTKPK